VLEEVPWRHGIGAEPFGHGVRSRVPYLLFYGGVFRSRDLRGDHLKALLNRLPEGSDYWQLTARIVFLWALDFRPVSGTGLE